MTAYTVTAGNTAFYMKLMVDAPNAGAAAALFRAYLDNTSSQEDEEYNMAVDLAEESESDRPDRDDFAYDFLDEDIEEFEDSTRWRVTPSAEVQMISSGGNG